MKHSKAKMGMKKPAMKKGGMNPGLKALLKKVKGQEAMMGKGMKKMEKEMAKYGKMVAKAGMMAKKNGM
jgi:hypothetical protein